MKIIECFSEKNILSTYPVMLQLRPGLPDANTYLKLIKNLQAHEKFRLIAIYESDICVGAAGFRVQSTLFRNGHAEIYVNDLIVDSKCRGAGYGKALIDWLREETHKISDCIGLTLDSGNQRVETHEFYRKQGFNQTALHFYCPKHQESVAGLKNYQTKA
jgi:GNAT superfamily N-acetyltransferase